jgi:antitoxin ParD1/3/4
LRVDLETRPYANPQRQSNSRLDRFVADKVKSGRYEHASEADRPVLGTLEREESEPEEKLATLRAAIDAGDASGVAEGNVFGRVRRTLKFSISR